jgi:predicted nucleic acid-binding Zn ribbon protein
MERDSVMTTYIYETIPQTAGETPVRFEVKQGMLDSKLTEQPGTGIPARRLISGGFTLLRRDPPSAGSVTDASWHQKD